MLSLLSSLEVSLAALHCYQSSHAAEQLTPLDLIFSSVRDNVAGEKWVAPLRIFLTVLEALNP